MTVEIGHQFIRSVVALRRVNLRQQPPGEPRQDLAIEPFLGPEEMQQRLFGNASLRRQSGEADAVIAKRRELARGNLKVTVFRVSVPHMGRIGEALTAYQSVSYLPNGK